MTIRLRHRRLKARRPHPCDRLDGRPASQNCRHMRRSWKRLEWMRHNEPAKFLTWIQWMAEGFQEGVS